MDTEIDTLRKAHERNWHRLKYTEHVLYRLMLMIDRSDLDFHHTTEYKDASHILGWDVDWEELASKKEY